MPSASSKAGMRTETLAVVLGLGIAVCLAGVRLLTGERESLPLFLLLVAGAFLPYFGALLLLRRAGARLRAPWVIGLAVLINVAPFAGKPLWDNDAYRYHWDGLVLAHGVNPYEYAPGDHALAPLRDRYWPGVDYKAIRTIYPPLTEALLAATYWIDPTPRRVLVLAVVGNLLCL